MSRRSLSRTRYSTNALGSLRPLGSVREPSVVVRSTLTARSSAKGLPQEVEPEGFAKVASALVAQQDAHQRRVELLLEQHFLKVVDLLSTPSGEGRGSILAVPEKPCIGPSACVVEDPGPEAGAVSWETAMGTGDGHGVGFSRHYARIGSSWRTTQGVELNEHQTDDGAGGGGEGAPRRMDSWDKDRTSWCDRAGMTMKDLENSYDAVAPMTLPKTLTRAVSCSSQELSAREGVGATLAGDLRHGQVRSAAAKITQSYAFEIFFQTVIIANAVFMGAEEDWQVRHVGQTLPGEYYVADLAFSILFFAEFCMRVLADFPLFFLPRNSELRWNLFDTVLMCSAVSEVILKYSTESNGFDVSTGRLLRLLRLVRIVRVLRVFRFFKALRVVVLSILASVRPLLFALMLLFILIYFVAVCILQFVTEEFAYLRPLSGGRESDHFKALERSYGSLSRATYTLFLSISGGLSWGEACDPLIRISVWLGLFFLMYVAVCVFCILNIITGMFVEEAAAKTAEDEDNMMIHEIQRRKRFIGQVKMFFEAADKNGTGLMSWPDFEELVKEVRMQNLLEKLGIDVVGCGAQNLFDLFDNDGNGAIDIDEFTSALTQMRGPARSTDLASLRHQHRKTRRDLKLILQCLDGHAHRIGADGTASATPPPALAVSQPADDEHFEI